MIFCDNVMFISLNVSIKLCGSSRIVPDLMLANAGPAAILFSFPAVLFRHIYSDVELLKASTKAVAYNELIIVIRNKVRARILWLFRWGAMTNIRYIHSTFISSSMYVNGAWKNPPSIRPY